MGHYASEIDEQTWQNENLRLHRKLELRKIFKDVPMTEFTVGEMEAIMRLMGLAYNAAGTLEPHREHIELLEKKAATLGLR